jgi:hypothetical protein
LGCLVAVSVWVVSDRDIGSFFPDWLPFVLEIGDGKASWGPRARWHSCEI